MLFTPNYIGYIIRPICYKLKTKTSCTGSKNCNSERRTIGVSLLLIISVKIKRQNSVFFPAQRFLNFILSAKHAAAPVLLIPSLGSAQQ